MKYDWTRVDPSESDPRPQANAFSTECSAADYAASGGCDCYGGAARRVAAFTSRGEDVVALDTGAHFFGSGLFFNEW